MRKVHGSISDFLREIHCIPFHTCRRNYASQVGGDSFYDTGDRSARTPESSQRLLIEALFAHHSD
jgi:hypothetical protein